MTGVAQRPVQQPDLSGPPGATGQPTWVEAPDTEGKLASRVAAQIESDILAAGWPAGYSLGSEPQLAERYGVSRTVLREAIRLVEHRQVAVMRMGPSGGLTVRRPDIDGVVVAAAVFLDYAGATLDDLQQARAVLEPLAAGLAADRATEAAIAELRRAIAADAGDDPVHTASVTMPRVSRRIAHASGNAAVALFVDVLLHLVSRYSREPAPTDEHFGEVLAGDAATATYCAREHMQLTRSWLRPKPPVSALSRLGAHVKLAEVVAADIYTEIIAAGWPVGAVLGSEAALMAQHGVSRAVLREAIRLLEHHRVAEMRRGRGGGLIATYPDQQACTDTAVHYLARSGVDLHTLHLARRAIEVACLDLVMGRGAHVGERLADTVGREHLRYEAGQDGFGCDLHAGIAEHCGNPVLGLFARVLAGMYSRTVANRAEEFDWPGASAEITGAHRSILDAIRLGDADIARRRLAHHLEHIHSVFDRPR